MMENKQNMSNQNKTSQGTQQDALLDNDQLNEQLNEQLNDQESDNESLDSQQLGSEKLSNENVDAEVPHADTFNTESLGVKFDEITDVFNKLSKIAQEAGQWSESTIKLFFIEILRNVEAAKRFAVCQLLFIPLLILFIFSICICIGIIAYSFTSNLLIAVGMFLSAMGLVLVALAYWQKYLMRFFGFKATIAQLKEGADVISKAAKSFD